jgi:hypothetical protein
MSTLSALDAAPVWLNAEPLTAQGLRGRTVLLDVCTYSCVNWLRTLPYVRAWAQKYADQGLTVIGVHAPEFGFEHMVRNVRRALDDLDVRYPVVLDNDFVIWESLRNRFWPAVYLVDRDDAIAFRTFGEGNYAETETAIQQALGIRDELAVVDANGLARAADWDALGTGETYLGDGRGSGRAAAGEPLDRNRWALTGRWRTEPECAVLEEAGGGIAMRFLARDVNLVVAPPADGRPVGLHVRLDGAPPGADCGLDVDADGHGVLEQPRMYQLVRQAGGAAERTVEIAFDAAGVRAYVFTFG